MFRPLTSVLGRVAAALGAALAVAGMAVAQTERPPDYSARAVHILPDGTQTAGMVVKSGSDIRMEYSEQGRQIVQIVRQAEGLMLLLDPANKTYAEIRGAPSPDPTGAGYLPPCQENDPSLTCAFKGNEVSSGINAELWELSSPGQPGTTLLLWDGARHRALRQVFPDGTTMKMSFLRTEDLEGRQVEHWTIAYKAPGQAEQTGEWYFDPILRVEMKEVLPTGEIRSLENIKVGPVDPSNFAVPSGWTRLDLPQAPVYSPGSGN